MTTYACCQHCDPDCPQRATGHVVRCIQRAGGQRCAQGGTPFAGRAE